MALNFANNNSLSAITALPASISSGALNLISTQTASNSTSLSFTTGIDSTYKEYIFKLINIHPATDEAQFTFQASANGGSSYGIALTSSTFAAINYEDESSATLAYRAGDDLAQSTSYHRILHGIGNGNDESGTGTLEIFEPSSTTFVKHFKSSTSNYMSGSAANNYFSAGYFNTTSALNAFDFKFHSGNIDSGVIKLYGVS